MAFLFQIRVDIEKLLAIVYLTSTRPNIAYVVLVVSQFVARSTSVHWAMDYSPSDSTLSTTNRVVVLSLTVLHGFSNFDWAGDVNDRKSATRVSIFLGFSFISWKSKKQDVSEFSAEAEYKALSDTTVEIIWLQWCYNMI